MAKKGNMGVVEIDEIAKKFGLQNDFFSVHSRCKGNAIQKRDQEALMRWIETGKFPEEFAETLTSTETISGSIAKEKIEKTINAVISGKIIPGSNPPEDKKEKGGE